jgi:OOP family OmpA-OmpF porin
MRGIGVVGSIVALAAIAIGCASPPSKAMVAPPPPSLPLPITVVDCPSDAAACIDLAEAKGCTTGPEDVDGFEDDDGCADLDNDMDRLLDSEDKCPDEPEVYNGFDDEDGCPDKSICVFGGGKLTILDVVRFDDKGVKVAAESMPIVDAIVATLKGNPQIQLVEIEGHSDERGDEKVNLAITDKRAKAVMALLIEKGVDKSRLRAKGFGEYCPLDPAHTEEAWAKNRRVAFRIATYDGQKDYEELGCATAKAKGVVSDAVP